MMRRMGSAGLGIGQLFALIFGFLITSALIFLFGIWVGRDVAERRLAQEERVVRLPVPAQPTAREDSSGNDVDLSFYQSLKEKAYQRLQETAVAGTPTPAQAAAGVPIGQATNARAAGAPTPTAKAARGQLAQAPSPTRAAQRAAVNPPLTATPVARAKRPEPTASQEEWADAGWTVQVNATTNPDQATELARSLRAKGYDAYTVLAPMRGQTWYRVRVGRFTTRDKARELEARLKSAEGLENAYVTPK